MGQLPDDAVALSVAQLPPVCEDEQQVAALKKAEVTAMKVAGKAS